MTNTAFIYVLKEPDTGEIRYVGKSTNPKIRVLNHVYEAKDERKNNHRLKWFRSLIKRGLEPVLEIIDEVPELEWQAWEAAYIQLYRSEGHKLVNGTLGGEGTDRGESHPFFGKHHTIETRQSMSQSRKGKPFLNRRPMSLETRRKISDTMKRIGHLPPSCLGYKRSPEAIEKTSSKNRGQKRSPETCAKISAANKGRPAWNKGRRLHAPAL